MIWWFEFESTCPTSTLPAMYRSPVAPLSVSTIRSFASASVKSSAEALYSPCPSFAMTNVEVCPPTQNSNSAHKLI